MSDFILSDDDASTLKKLEEAACEHGIVMDLLSAIELWQRNGQPEPDDFRFFELAAMAAGLARVERKRQGIDKES